MQEAFASAFAYSCRYSISGLKENLFVIFIPTCVCVCVLFDFSVKLQHKTSSVAKLNYFLMSLMSLSVSNVINYDSQYAKASQCIIFKILFLCHTQTHTHSGVV